MKNLFTESILINLCNKLHRDYHYLQSENITPEWCNPSLSYKQLQQLLTRFLNETEQLLKSYYNLHVITNKNKLPGETTRPYYIFHSTT